MQCHVHDRVQTGAYDTCLIKFERHISACPDNTNAGDSEAHAISCFPLMAKYGSAIHFALKHALVRPGQDKRRTSLVLRWLLRFCAATYFFRSTREAFSCGTFQRHRNVSSRIACSGQICL
eukprot:313157-Pelagomonas_calceolata.AAC.1